MLCFVINKRDYEIQTISGYHTTNKYVCIGSIKNRVEAENIANILPCLTEVVILGKVPNKCCYILCTV